MFGEQTFAHLGTGFTLHAALQNNSVVCSGSQVTNSTVIQLRGSVNRGGVIVKTCTRSTCSHICQTSYTLLQPSFMPLPQHPKVPATLIHASILTHAYNTHACLNIQACLNTHTCLQHSCMPRPALMHTYNIHTCLNTHACIYNNNNNSYTALYPVNIYKLAALYIINIKIRLTINNNNNNNNKKVQVL